MKAANIRAVGINSPKTSSRNVAAEGGIVSVYYGGTLVGALIAGSLADRAGRIKAVVFGAMWALLGAILQASAQNIAWMCCVSCGFFCLDEVALLRERAPLMTVCTDHFRFFQNCAC